MRSRYAAFAVGDEDHLFRTWHPRTRPSGRLCDPSITWLGLEIHDVVAGGREDDEGIVEFTAQYRGQDGHSGAMRERSSFIRRAGRWMYVDGDTSTG